MPLTFVSLTRQIYALRKRGPRKAARFWGLLCALTLAALLIVGILQESRAGGATAKKMREQFRSLISLWLGSTKKLSIFL